MEIHIPANVIQYKGFTASQSFILCSFCKQILKYSVYNTKFNDNIDNGRYEYDCDLL